MHALLVLNCLVFSVGFWTAQHTNIGCAEVPGLGHASKKGNLLEDLAILLFEDSSQVVHKQIWIR